MREELGYTHLATMALTVAAGGDQAAPASGATVTLYDSGDTTAALNRGDRWKRLIVSIISSHDSAASGLKFEESNDGGTNWDVVYEVTVSGSTYTKNYVAMSGKRVRVRYVNSANTLTTFRGCILGDPYERGTVS